MGQVRGNSIAMNIELKYGHSCIRLNIPDRADISVLGPDVPPPLPDPAKALEQALDEPIGAPRLDPGNPPRSMAIAVPDETRAVPVGILLPVLLRRIFTAWPGLKPEDVLIVVGGGLHAPMDEARLKRLLPAGCFPRVSGHSS